MISTVGCTQKAEPNKPKPAEAEIVNLVLASTTSTQDSGLFEVLIPAFEKDNPDINVQVLAVGSGEAIQKGRDGDADVLLVHAKADEEQFVADGFAEERSDVMYNDFVIVGPKNDPANIKESKDAVDALRIIAASKSPFISRGDDSGTHKKEMSLWAEVGVNPTELKDYEITGSGMGDTLKVAYETDAYTLSDRATFVSLLDTDAIASSINFQGSKDMLNQYGVLVVKTAKQLAAGEAFKSWVLSPAGQKVIETFGVDRYGEALFFPNAVTK